MNGDAIVLYTTAAGRSPVEEFLESIQDVKAEAHCRAFLERLVNPGPPLQRKHAEQIEGRLWELKPSYRRVEYRFLYAQLRDGRYLILHAVVKKRDRLPRREFDTALERLADYEGRQQ